MYKYIACVLFAFALLAPPGTPVQSTAQADQTELRILTSFPESFVEPFLVQFELLHPGIRVLVQNKNTVAAVDEILRGNDRKFDLFWASSPEAFARLNMEGEEGLLSAQADVFALSGVGWAYLKGASPPPRRLEDFAGPEFAGRLAMGRPARSGTNHLFVEFVLQNQGWEYGWRTLLGVSGNFAAVTPRSFTVIEGVVSGRFDYGVAIDFLALAHADPKIDFSYGDRPFVFGARIARLKGGQGPEASGKFVEFVLSKQGQELLLLPEVKRVPVDPELQEKALEQLPASMKNAFTTPSAGFDSELSAKRYWAVNALFDAFITYQLPKRQALWQRVHALEAAGISTQEIKGLLLQMPISEEALLSGEDLPIRATRFTVISEEQVRMEQDWRKLAADLLETAERAIADQEYELAQQ